jgi:hypothetical protein
LGELWEDYSGITLALVSAQYGKRQEEWFRQRATAAGPIRRGELFHNSGLVSSRGF